MANYITMAVNPITGSVYDYFKQANPDIIERYAYLANSLDNLLEQHDIDIVDLFHALAIRYSHKISIQRALNTWRGRLQHFCNF